MEQPLIPPDLQRCQAEHSNGQSFMTFGGGPKMVRCQNKPSVIMVENEPGTDGRQGSMSLCARCLQVLQAQLGVTFATPYPIEP